MVKLKVYNIKPQIHQILKIVIVILIIVVVLKLISNKVQAVTFNDNEKSKSINVVARTINKISIGNLNKCLEDVIPIFSYLAEEKTKDEKKEIYISVKNILKYELGTLNKIIEEESLNVNEKELTNDDKAELLEYDKVQTEVQESTVEEKYSNEIESVKIKNTSNYEITEEMLNLSETDEYTYSRNVMIFHTHTCESYTSESGYEYEATGNYRTTDLNFSVARVGDELENNLKNFKFNVIHDKTYHDFPTYSGSYNRSYETVQQLVNENKDYNIIFDIHRDAVGSNGEYAPTVKVGDEYAAQIMFVIGTNGGGLEHDEWQKNLAFAVKVQKKANELYPGLFKPIMLSNSRFNQNLARGACIIEVGATGNTLKQAVNSMKYLSIVLDNVI